MPSDYPIEIILKSRRWPENGLPVDKASPSRPDDVRDALLEALRQVRHHSSLLIEVKLLHIELIIDHTLREHESSHWNPTPHFKHVLQSCRHAAKVYNPPCLEGNSYKYAEVYKQGKGAQVVIILSILPKELLPSIEALPEAEQKRLAKFMADRVITISMDTWIIREFDIATKRIPEQAKKLPRPRVRNDDDNSIISSAPLMNYLEPKRNRSPSPVRSRKRAKNVWYSPAPQFNLSSLLPPARYSIHNCIADVTPEDIATTLGYSTAFPARQNMILPRPELLDAKSLSAQYSRPTTIIPDQTEPLNHSISELDNTAGRINSTDAICEDFPHAQEVLTELEGWENAPDMGVRLDADGNNENYFILPGWENAPDMGVRRDAIGPPDGDENNVHYFILPGWENAPDMGVRRDAIGPPNATGYGEDYLIPPARENGPAGFGFVGRHPSSTDRYNE